MNLVGNDELHSEDQLRALWKESMKSVNCTTAHIAYDNFLLLMKGQTKEPEIQPPSSRVSWLNPVPEGISIAESIAEENVEEMPESPHKETKESPPHSPRVANLSEAESLLIENRITDEGSMSSLPNMTSPVMYDESSNSSLGMPAVPSMDSPLAAKVSAEVQVATGDQLPDFAALKKPSTITRGRSKSLADESESFDESSAPAFHGDTRRALALPERDPKVTEELAKNQSALAVSRHLYRAHRQMRLAVLEASRRFEEEQARRARDALMAQKTKEAGMMGLGQAGLVMRHGHREQVTTDAIRRYLDQYRAEQQQLVEKATRRGGRGRSKRKKTISDMSSMMNPSLGQDELAVIVSKAALTPEGSKNLLNASFNDLGEFPDLKGMVNGAALPAPTKTEDVTTVDSVAARPSIQMVDKTLRKATVPGHFHQTKDPFSSDGMYGGARIGLVDVNQIKSKPKKKK